MGILLTIFSHGNIYPRESTCCRSNYLLVRKIKGTHFSPNIYGRKYIYPSNIIFAYVDNHKGKYMGMFMLCGVNKSKEKCIKSEP